MLTKHKKSTSRTFLGLICCVLIASCTLTTQTPRDTQNDLSVSTILIPEIIDEFLNMSPSDVEIPSFTVTESNNSDYPYNIELKGTANLNSSIRIYMQSLDYSEMFTDLFLFQVTRDEGSDTADFILRMLAKKP
jgi:hypothetical protein